MITTKSLRVDYEDLTAVYDLDLNIQKGQIYGLVGPNGAGKTSTIKALAGIIEPTYGEIKIAGIDLDLYPQQALQKLGYMPDFPPLYENLKVIEYLEIFAAAYHIVRSNRFELANFWLTKVDLLGKKDTFVRTLSRGMRQRLVLAKTLLHDPDVLLLDEPASGLDPIARKEMRDILKEVAKLGKTIIISSHILPELSDFCNAIGIMEKGRMVVSGSLEEIRAHIGSKGVLIISLSATKNEDKEKLETLLKNSNLVKDFKEVSQGEFQAQFLGEQNDSAKLLTQLIQAGLTISNFQLKQDSVEDIFFQIGAKEAS